MRDPQRLPADPGRLRGRAADRRVHPGEVERPEVQRQGGLQILPLLRERAFVNRVREREASAFAQALGRRFAEALAREVATWLS